MLPTPRDGGEKPQLKIITIVKGMAETKLKAAKVLNFKRFIIFIIPSIINRLSRGLQRWQTNRCLEQLGTLWENLLQM
jgi:hypothetical protein